MGASTGIPTLISPSVILAVLQTLFAALLSLGALGGPELSGSHRQGHAVREAATGSYTFDARAVAADEESDRSDPHQSGGDMLLPTVSAHTQVPTRSDLRPLPFAALKLIERTPRAHFATGPPVA